MASAWLWWAAVANVAYIPIWYFVAIVWPALFGTGKWPLLWSYSYWFIEELLPGLLIFIAAMSFWIVTRGLNQDSSNSRNSR